MKNLFIIPTYDSSIATFSFTKGHPHVEVLNDVEPVNMFKDAAECLDSDDSIGYIVEFVFSDVRDVIQILKESPVDTLDRFRIFVISPEKIPRRYVSRKYVHSNIHLCCADFKDFKTSSLQWDYQFDMDRVFAEAISQMDNELKESEDMDRLLTLSTAHIKEETAAYLDSEADEDTGTGPIPIEKMNYGWLVYVSDYKNMDDVPVDLINCISYAEAVGADVICFDGDGPQVEELPSYTW